MRGDSVQYLSRNDIEQIAGRIIDQYKRAFIPNRHMCYNVDIIRLASLLGYEIEYVHITQDGSILGKTSSGQIWTRIYDDKMNELYYLLDGHTILVDKRLLSSPALAGRKNFTIAHELAHQIINHDYPGVYGPINTTFCDHRRSVKPKCEINDWHEWQADALAAALLLPLDALKDAMFMFGLGEKMKLLSKKYSDTNYKRFCEMADYLQVSRAALSYRMEQFGLLENNRLLEDIKPRKGAA
jgi:Zn-dependent peptidase ImmA (M78 family)